MDTYWLVANLWRFSACCAAFKMSERPFLEPTPVGPEVLRQQKAWHPVSRLVLGKTAQLTAPSEPIEYDRKIAIYARYSTDLQKQSSIERQVRKCANYASKYLKRTSYVVFSDIALSGASLEDRERILALVDAIEKGLFTDVITEDFDRWSREVFDAVYLGRIFERCSVRLHLASLRRPITKIELIEHAKHAEIDRHRRTTLLSDGLDQLVEAGGVPWGACFGYVDGEVPGFPDVCPIARKSIERLFELARSNSDTDTAKALKREAYVCPNGTTSWTKTMVAQIRRRQIYIGVIHYRKTYLAKNEKGKKERRSRPEYEWIIGYNEKYKIVDEELFVEVHRAKEAAWKVRGSNKNSTRNRASWFGHPVCDCAGAPENQKYGFDARNFICSRYREHWDCACPLGASIPSSNIESAILNLVAETVQPLLDDQAYRSALLESLRQKSCEIEARRQALIRERDAADRKAEKLLDEALEGFSPARLARRRIEIEERVKELSVAVERLPRIHLDQIDIEGTGASLREGLAALQPRIPFVPESDSDRIIIKVMRKLVRRVVIERHGRPVHSAGISVDVAVEALLCDQDEIEVEIFPVVNVRTEVDVRTFYLQGGRARQALEQLAASGRYALTDEQWSLVADSLPDMAFGYGHTKHLFPTRIVANALIFKLRTGVQLNGLPTAFGDPKKIGRAVERLVYAGGLETLTSVLGTYDPAWLEGLHLESVAGIKRGAAIHKRSWSTLRPKETAAKYARTKQHSLTDEQWEAIKDAIHPRVTCPKGRAKTISARQIVDGLLIKLRSYARFEKLPPELGAFKDLRAGAISLVRSGSWARIIKILADKFPSAIEGLDRDWADNLLERINVKENRRAQQRRVNRDTGMGIKSNLRAAVKAPTQAVGCTILKAFAKTGLKRGQGSRYLRPDVVVGREIGKGRRIRREEMVILDTTNGSRRRRDRTKISLYKNMSSLTDFVFVYADEIKVDHYSRRGRWTRQIFTRLDDEVSFAALGMTIRLAEIYRGSVLVAQKS